ncbi:MAG: RidA family protein [Pseudomonadota bacterium]
MFSAKLRALRFLLGVFCLLPIVVAAEQEIIYHNMPGVEEANLPFSSAVQVGNTLYLSGTLGNVPGKFELVPGGIEAETRRTMDSIKAMVERFGSSMDRVVKCTVFMADMDEWEAMNKVYRTYFKRLPARSAFGSAKLALDARVEIDCIAIVGDSE